MYLCCMMLSEINQMSKSFTRGLFFESPLGQWTILLCSFSFRAKLWYQHVSEIKHLKSSDTGLYIYRNIHVLLVTTLRNKLKTGINTRSSKQYFIKLVPWHPIILSMKAPLQFISLFTISQRLYLEPLWWLNFLKFDLGIGVGKWVSFSIEHPIDFPSTGYESWWAREIMSYLFSFSNNLFGWC